MEKPDFSSIEAKVQTLSCLYPSDETSEDRFERIIDAGRSLPPLDIKDRTPDLLVPGCQSKLYLKATLINDHVHFTVHSDALISAGLASLLLTVYSGEKPLVVLLYPPKFLMELKILSSLSPSRSNGAISLYKKMQCAANQFII